MMDAGDWVVPGPDAASADGGDSGPVNPDDRDGDGTDNTYDNCPFMANDQTDFDNDNIGDACDNCVRTANYDQLDADGNGKGDVCESTPVYSNDDDDGDGVKNSDDLCKDDPDPLNKDSDNDTIGDVCDNCVSSANTHQTDDDGDGMGDNCGLGGDLTNSDGDSHLDANDNCKNVDNEDQADDDKDRIGNACDNCPSTANFSQADDNDDNIGNACEGMGSSPDADDDGDGDINKLDNCPLEPNENQEDEDKDGVGDECDNCWMVANADQKGPQGSNTGEACKDNLPAQSDDDGDGKKAAEDNCPSVSNADQADSDNDTRGDACDNCPSIANYSQIDANNNGTGDACDNLILDDDNDGIPNGQDKCKGSPNNADADNDNVGDACDNCDMHANAGQRNSDGDEFGDACDNDDLPPGATCASGTTQANPLATNLYFLVDQSGSMNDNACSFSSSCQCTSGNTTNCNSVTGGSVPQRERAWEDAVRTLKSELSNGRYNLGVATFSGGEEDPNDPECTDDQPDESLVMVAGSGNTFANNFESAAQITPGGATPTPAALLGTLDPNHDNNLSDARYLLDGDSQSAVRAKAVVLVTDGLPTRCPGNGRDTGDAEMRAAVNAARRVAQNGTQVFVLGFDIGEDTRFQLLANAGDPTNSGPYYYCSGSSTSNVPCICNGSGNSPSGCTQWANVKKTRWYVVSDTTSIINAVRAIARSTVSCTLNLTASGGTVDGSVSRVRFVTSSTSTVLAASEYVLSGNSLTLQTTACNNLRSSVQTDMNARIEVELGCACVPSTEICGDGKDNNCNGLIDENCPPPTTTCGVNADPTNCPTCPNPGLEVCDGVDNNCNTLIDEGCPPPGCTKSPEICGDMIDNDCDKDIDEDCPPTCSAGPEVCDLADNDCDGLVDEGCDIICRPFAEICNNLDDNCNDQIDEGCAMCASASNEVCDGIDNDCDTLIDEGCPSSPG